MSSCRHEQKSGSHQLEPGRREHSSSVAAGRNDRTTHDRTSANRFAGEPGAEHGSECAIVADATRSRVEMAATFCPAPAGGIARWLALGQASALRREHRKTRTEATGSSAPGGAWYLDGASAGPGAGRCQ